ncbi:unnamed protein product [Darwinula stevensoni]|uniref:Protein sleepless n=1 Tax=Darwinula stevensoni TaxID=69355 RepID=A0A7R9ADR3_9CRUS|nr:unnamed protein product [Darwinula stevensoni]CAG0901554.1 unnamed protein product [Darwinula stevensoni]
MLLGALILSFSYPALGTINCYTCVSRNGSDINCEDPFHPAMSKYKMDCMVPKRFHQGKFPANFCLKIIGKNAVTQESLVIRTCILENMNSQCGIFRFDDVEMTGCVLTCNSDGCNRSPKSGLPDLFVLVLLVFSVLVLVSSFPNFPRL